MKLEDFKNLINFWISIKKRSFLDELGEDAANSPDVNT